MMLRSPSLGLVSLVTLLGVAAGGGRAIAQTTYDFDTFYDTTVILKPITPEVAEASISGNNPNAPYGLTNFTSKNYSQFNPSTNTFTFVPDAAQFGLQGLPAGADLFFGSGEDRLFGTSNATATFDNTGTLNGVGTITITGGAGKFAGATGIFNFTESEPPGDPTAPLKGTAFLKGSFQTPVKVSEPRSNMTAIAFGMIGAGFVLRRRKAIASVK